MKGNKWLCLLFNNVFKKGDKKDREVWRNIVLGTGTYAFNTCGTEKAKRQKFKVSFLSGFLNNFFRTFSQEIC